jgi:hypothetical protein
MTTVRELKIGDKIMPPRREIRLWMRRHAAERNLPESALALTIIEIREGNVDKGGRWLVVKCLQTPEWTANFVDPDPAAHKFTFKARAETPWQMAI